VTRQGWLLCWLLAGPCLAHAALAQPSDLDALNRIRAEELDRSQVMEIARELTDGIGPRLTGSPALRRAAEWARGRLAGWGVANARLEPFEFGDGWQFTRCEVRLLEPQVARLAALPKAWTPGTAGAVRGEAVRAKLETPEDLEAQKGKLAGKIVFLDGLRSEQPAENGRFPIPDFERYDKDRLEDLVQMDLREPRGEAWRERARKRYEQSARLAEFLKSEGALATVELSSRDFGILRVGGESANRDPARPRGVPGLVMAAEPYQRIVRLLEQGERVELEVNVEASFLNDDMHGYDVLAEIPGGDRGREIVMAGAHLDSWHAGTGATDDGAGVAVVLEAARILRGLGLTPRRTIRFALWGGEEQGLLGSSAYVEKYVATRPEPTDPAERELPRSLRKPTWPLRLEAEHPRLSAYFNLDNGGGRIRGIYTQGNVAVAPIFRAWLEPLADLGASTVTNESTGSTDHVPFDRVGVPAFQFVQDPLDYATRTHHTDLDTYERLRREDLVQASIVMAAFLWDAAQRDAMLPRKALPQAPPEPASPKSESRPAAPPAERSPAASAVRGR
jgi:carboxypeptidase Q